MGAIIYDEFQTSLDDLPAALSAALNASTDWTPVAESYGTATTLSAAEAIGQTTISVTSSADFAAGDIVVFERGTANEEFRTLVSVGGSTLSVVTTTAIAHASGTAVEKVNVSAYALQGPGGHMIDFAADTPSVAGHGNAVSRDASGTDKRLAYNRLIRNTNFPTVTVPVHVVLSAGPEHVMIVVSGPRVGEPGAESAPYRSALFLGEVIPYDDADLSTPWFLAGHNNINAPAIKTGEYGFVDRNAADTASWVQAVLLAPCFPVIGNGSQSSDLQPRVNLIRDGVLHLWPYVVAETTDGPRGRLKNVFYAGPSAIPGQLVVYDGITYIGVEPGSDVSTSYNNTGPFGTAMGNTLSSLVVFVPYSGTPA